MRKWTNHTPLTLVDGLLTRDMAAALLKALVTFVLLYVLVDLLAARRVAIKAHNVPWSIVAAYYLALTPEIMRQVAPLAVLVCGLLVLGRMAQDREIIALLAGGVSLRRIVRAPVAVALCFALAVLAMQDTVGVRAAERARYLRANYLSRSPDVHRPARSWANLSGEWTLHVGKFNRLAMTGEDVLASSVEGPTVQHIRANRIFWEPGEERWLLEDGRWWTFPKDAPGTARIRRITQMPAPFTESPRELFAMGEPAETKSTRELLADLGRARRYGQPTRRLEVDLHNKFAQPAVNLVMVLLAIPFAVRLRRGGIAISFGLSVAIAMAYLLVYGAASGLGYTGHLPPAFSAWLANAVFLVAGLALLAKTPT